MSVFDEQIFFSPLAEDTKKVQTSWKYYYYYLIILKIFIVSKNY